MRSRIVASVGGADRDNAQFDRDSDFEPDFRFLGEAAKWGAHRDDRFAEKNEPARAGERCARGAEPAAHDTLTN